MSNSSSLYLTGKKEFNFVTQEKNNSLLKWTESQIKKTQTIKKLVCGDGLHFLVWKKPNKLELYEKDNKKRKYQLPKNETIKDIASSRYTYLILTESGKVWSLAKSNRYKVVPLLDADQSTFEEIRPVTFFEEKKLFVNSVVMGYGSVYYLCNGDQLYASGSNDYGRLGIGQSKGKKPVPVYVQDKVTKIFSGSSSFGFFFITSHADLLYSSGDNRNGQLGVVSTFNQVHWRPTVVQNFIGSEILTIKEESCPIGNRTLPNLGFNRPKRIVWLGVYNEDFYYPTDESNYHKLMFPRKISLPGFFTNYLGSKDQIRIAIGSDVNFLYLDFKNTLSQDLRILYETKKFCNCEIGTLGNLIPVHKALIECRTKLTIDQIQNKLFGEKSINKEQTLNFLKWIYYDEISDIEKLEQTFNLLELKFPPSVDNTLEKDIAQLYQDDDSKDFKILVKIDDKDEEEEKKRIMIMKRIMIKM
ncbi:claret [Anaeramoeba flamelloides]|uniref:Claret n=1 Tax=Anaeramoeba flamelloides TaxID=1746091 RepID=A0ABQ8XE76_9EUKA|nr:claret [Anaeramoeba flamelloides]